MTYINSPQQRARRDVRYPLDMPVTLKLAHKLARARSENISLHGILLSSASRIPVGSAVDVAVGVATLPDHGVQLNAHGKVLRAQPRSSGDFAVAIEFERPFELGLQTPESGAPAKHPRILKAKNRIFPNQGSHLAATWYTET